MAPLWRGVFNSTEQLIALLNGNYTEVKGVSSAMHTVKSRFLLLENIEHCGGEPEQAANMHMNRLSFTLK